MGLESRQMPAGELEFGLALAHPHCIRAHLGDQFLTRRQRMWATPGPIRRVLTTASSTKIDTVEGSMAGE